MFNRFRQPAFAIRQILISGTHLAWLDSLRNLWVLDFSFDVFWRECLGLTAYLDSEFDGYLADHLLRSTHEMPSLVTEVDSEEL